ncbi:macrolide ABC transporter ATP-binding protein [Spongiactinospora gelatinilytica]|uniref:Macrolide ABC transporter ATP-binding protein n=1 Tax=Spongiactinospora gelatinilytica TaxID=2666298 RepID=A0A2W2G336_9ACTN|nr:ABC transporter ATP-binding protein [Spongiactinospora gelatinilytica]PZG36779.1 macrolide ABC transporter ATP-binding protein [Spongiactinospora gelatinilytica]
MAEPGTAEPVIRLVDVDRVFPAEPPVHALRGTSLRVAAGDYVAVNGPSGSGKSTLLNTLGLLDRPTSGRYLLDGIDTTTLPDGERTRLRGGRIGFVFQSFHLLQHRPVLENVMLAEVYRQPPTNLRKGRRARAAQALERVGMGHRADFPPNRLSGGERQRVAVARALLGRPSLLLCDEPTGNLDGHNTTLLLDLFDELREQGLTIVVSTHEDEVSSRAGRRVRIIDGVLREE